MKSQYAVLALGALAQQSRLAIFRALVKRGPDGYTPTQIAARVRIPAPTLSFHLKELHRADLIAVRRDGRFLHYSANFATMDALVDFLTESCCNLADNDHAGVCTPGRNGRRRA